MAFKPKSRFTSLMLQPQVDTQDIYFEEYRKFILKPKSRFTSLMWWWQPQVDTEISTLRSVENLFS